MATPRETYGFTIYIYKKQKGKVLKRDGNIAFLDERGKQSPQAQAKFHYLDEIPTLIRKQLQRLEKLEKDQSAKLR